MPSLLGTTVAANYGRMTDQQTYATGTIYSNFGTRQLRFVKAVVSGGSNNDLRYADGATNTTSYKDALSLFSKAVRALQTGAEIYFVGTPSASAFVFAISEDTVNDSDTTDNIENAGYGDLEAAIASAIGSGTVTLSTLTATGASIA